jgi:peroxiredoxin
MKYAKHITMKNMMLAALGLYLFSSCQAGGGGYTIQGNLTHLTDSVLYLARQEGSMPVFDTLKVAEGKFSFSGKADHPTFAQIITSDQRAGFPLYLEPGTIEITGNADSMAIGKVSVSGTPNNDDLNAFMQIQQPYVPMMMAMQSNYVQAQMSGDSVMAHQIEATTDSIQTVINGKMVAFVQDHPKSLVSVLVLRGMMNDLTSDQLSQLYSSLDTAVQHSEFGQPIGARLEVQQKTAIGKPAPDFTMNDTTGKPVSLSSFRGKYVLVDFWASWCGPCRAENPNVVKVYNQYKDKNFTILGVSLDQTKDAWEKAIRDDHLTWHHVSDLQFWDNSAAQLYGVEGIPANFLIGPDGKILAKDLRGDALGQKLAQLLQ